MKLTTKLGAIFFGIVLGMDLSAMAINDRVFCTDNLIILYAVIAIIFEFGNDKWFRQISRFSTAMIIGIAVREYYQLPMHVCFYISIFTIVGVVVAVTIKGIRGTEHGSFKDFVAKATDGVNKMREKMKPDDDYDIDDMPYANADYEEADEDDDYEDFNDDVGIKVVPKNSENSEEGYEEFTIEHTKPEE